MTLRSVVLRAEQEEVERWQRIADVLGVSLADYVRQCVCTLAVGEYKLLFGDSKPGDPEPRGLFNPE